MFEGVVNQVLAGYLGRYVKGLQKDQLKIGIWKGEVLLEKVELILEAFDYLQLPFALKQGRIGKLNITIPWKKLGWNSIKIVLEDVFLCACPRDNSEWSLDSVEKREFAGKMAKLNAAELAKLSKRVSDNQAGQSFISYISAKILDNIEVFIRNVHVIYINIHNDLEKFVFGLRFSDLTMIDVRKQNLVGSSNGKLKSGQVNKIIEISTFGVYCNLLEEDASLLNIDNVNISSFPCNIKFDPERYDYLVNPFDITVSLLVNKSGKLDGAPQYSVMAELTALVVLLNETQLQQILSLWDHFSICSLRERYGRYRPDQNTLSRKPDGWQILLWHYAQESILVDVRRKLRKTSWSNLGRRINHRRRYVNLYKRKLELLQQYQSVNKDILEELEQMDKECEIDDILSYRSMAENQLLGSHNEAPSTITNDAAGTQGKQKDDEQSSSRARGWLNWLSLGMLGAGGTADYNSFAAVVSDEIIKDIYEAAEFHPLPSLNGESSTRDKLFLSLIKFNIHHFTMTISSERYDKEIARVLFDELSIESKSWEDVTATIALINSVEIINPYTEKALLISKKAFIEDDLLKHGQPPISVQVRVPSLNPEFGLSVKVVLQPFEVIYDSNFLSDILNFHHHLGSLQFQQERVLLALNCFSDMKARVLSKAEYIFSTRKMVTWDVSVSNVTIKLPWQNEDSEFFSMVLELGAFSCGSRPRMMLDCDDCLDCPLMNLLSTSSLWWNYRLEDFYDHFEICFTGLEGNIVVPSSPQTISAFEKCDASISFSLCIFLDEPMLKHLKVQCSVTSLDMHISPSIFDALVKLSNLFSEKASGKVILGGHDLHTAAAVKSSGLNFFHYSVSVKLVHFNFHVNLEDTAENSSVISFILSDVDIRYIFKEFLKFSFLVKMLKVNTCTFNDESNHILCSSRNSAGIRSLHVHAEDVGFSIPGNSGCEGSISIEECFSLHYQAQRNGFIVCHEYTICLNDADLHIHPRIIGLLQKSYTRISGHGYSSANPIIKSFRTNQETDTMKLIFNEDLQKYGFSNFCDVKSAGSMGIPLDHFPFVAIRNSGFPSMSVSSCMPSIPEWRSLYVEDKQCPKSQKADASKRSRFLTGSTIEFKAGCDAYSHLESAGDVNLSVVDFHLNGVRAHFHDSSCIFATITLPLCKCFLCFQEIDCWDILCSVDGFLLSSPWTPPIVHELLWGPALPSTSPILNIRVRKGKGEAEFPLTEISIAIQHVSCILPSEFLSMIIGYFSLPDWTFKRDESCAIENDKYENVQGRHSYLIYKLEILESTLTIPLESNTDYCLQLSLPQLHCNFIPQCSSADAVKDLSHEFVTPKLKLADVFHLVDVSGRGASLSLLFFKDGKLPLKSDQYESIRNIPIIAQLDADLWIRIPCETESLARQSTVPTFIMVRADICNIIAEDDSFLIGLEATMTAIDQLSLAGKESKNFKSDVLQFMQLKSNLREANTITLEIASVTLIDIKVFAKALSIKLIHSRMDHSTSSEPIAKADLQVIFSASLGNDILHNFDVDIGSLVLHSFRDSLLLLSFGHEASNSSCLRFNFSKSDQGGKELILAIPILDIWLHLSKWNEVFDLLRLYARQPTSTSFQLSRNAVDITQHAVDLTVRSDKIAFSFHLPIWDKEDALNKCGVTEAPKVSHDMLGENMPSFEAKHFKYIKFTMQSRDTKLTVSNREMKLKCNIEKMRTLLEMVENYKVSSMPFIQISHVKVSAEVHKNLEEFVDILSDVQVENLNVGLSPQIFNFWCGIQLAALETTASQTLLHSMIFHVNLKKGSMLLSDEKWNCNGPMLEILVRDVLVKANKRQSAMEGSVVCDHFLLNYKNIHKVMWEPFIEPWSFCLNLVRKNEGNVLINSSGMMDIQLKSKNQLNLNITEALIEVIFRVNQMLKGTWGENWVHELHESQGVLGFETTENIYTRRYAPYVLRNDTSLPLFFWMSRGPATADDTDILPTEDRKIVQPGSSIPIYVEESPDEHLHYRKTYSSERLIEKKLNGAAHHMISIQLDGTSSPSRPMSMDLVGLSYFEVNFSNHRTAELINVDRNEDASVQGRKIEWCKTSQNNVLVVPVVFDVSMQRYNKMIRLYSTVILLNVTSMPLELRFDIPFGISPKILDPILPGQEFPLPVHLAEAGQMRWRPVGSNYLWSEAHSLLDILSQENRPGFMRSSVCYPSHPSSDPFRCCISLQVCNLLSPCASKGLSLHINGTSREACKNSGQKMQNQDMSKKRFVRQVRMTTPLLVKNYLPTALSLTIDSGGVTNSIFLSEVDIASIFHIDSTHDLGITFHMQGFRPATSKFSRAETFMAVAKLNETKYCLSEELIFYPDTFTCPICVTVEKAMDAFCGAREICISVPFLLYNCTGFALTIVNDDFERKRNAGLVLSSYTLTGNEHLLDGKQGLAFVSSDIETFSTLQNINNSVNFLRDYHTIPMRRKAEPYYQRPLSGDVITPDFSYPSWDHFGNIGQDAKEVSFPSSTSSGSSTSQLNLSGRFGSRLDLKENGYDKKVMPCMYAPPGHLSGTDLMVRLQRYLPQRGTENNLNTTWSNPFSLVPASGSNNVAIPKPCMAEAFLISVTSNPVSGELSGRTRAIIFQPRYVICNACSNDLRYRQKGTGSCYSLGVGQHSHLHWTDRTRELLVSIQFSERGAEWSGSFFPDRLGDAQVKMRNYISGSLSMIRVEIQNADVSISDEKHTGVSTGNSGTYLILLSDDDTGFVPYRIDNFSMETLRIYQQKCEKYATVVHSYTSCQYAWDEPCYPHRLVVEVPGERILGTYSFDDLRECTTVCLPPTSEKPERRFFVAIHAEGATKVLSIIDSSYHAFGDIKETGFLGFHEKKKINQQMETNDDFNERIIIHLPFIGVSLITSSPQELVFACAKETKIILAQNLNQQKISFQISSLQIDNQLYGTPYPIMLSFDHDYRGSYKNHIKIKENKTEIQNENTSHGACDSMYESVFYLAAAKWRKKECSIVSYEYVNLGVAPLHIEIGEQVLLHLFDFLRTISSRLQNGMLQNPNFELQPLDNDTGVYKGYMANDEEYKYKKSMSSSQFHSNFMERQRRRPSLPSVVPIGAPWQQIFHLARRQKKIYVEVFEVSSIKMTVSFSSTPWMIWKDGLTEAESFINISTAAFQRGLMALVDVEGVPVHLKQLTLAHLMASWESIREIINRHYTRQLLHEMYKVFGSAGVIGNPMGFARNVRLGIKDFLSVSAKGILQSPTGLITGMAQGSKSLLGNTVYAVSSAASQFSKAAHKGIVAFTFDEQAVAKMENWQRGLDTNGKGVLNEFLEGLTGLLQSPIKGAEKHGLPGVISGIALGTAGLVARPIASILEATGKTAQSIRNRSGPHQPNLFRIRFPRPLAKELPLLPYSWEEAIGVSMLLEADGSRLKDEIFVKCKTLKQAGKFIILTERLVLVVACSSLVGFDSPGFVGIADPEWVIELEMCLESVIHIDREEVVVNIVGSNAETVSRLKKSSTGVRIRSPPNSVPLFQMSVELPSQEDAEDVLQATCSMIEKGKVRRWGVHVVCRSNLRGKNVVHE